MRNQLHVINGSHPCATVLRALELKGIDVRIRESLPPLHTVAMRIRFRQRRVPVLVLGETGEVIAGSRPIMRKLDELAPEPALYPAGNVAVEQADAWGEEVLQPAARILLWLAIKHSPKSLASFQGGSHLPSLPRPLVRLSAPLIVAGEERLNGITPEAQQAALGLIPELGATLKAFDEAGAFGEGTPTAADLQIGSSLQLIRALDDLRHVNDGHRVLKKVARWLPASPGRVPAGAIPQEMLDIAAIPAPPEEEPAAL